MAWLPLAPVRVPNPANPYPFLPMSDKTNDIYFLFRLKVSGERLPEPQALAAVLEGARVAGATGGELEILSADPIQQGFSPEQYHQARIMFSDGAGGTLPD